MVPGILGDVHVKGSMKDLVRLMQTQGWAEFWKELGIAVFRFEEVGLTPTSTDLEIWNRCQDKQLVLITNNRNSHTEDSLEATIRRFNKPDSLPVFTIGDLDKFQKNRDYARRVVEMLYEYLSDIDRVRGTGRLYLP